MKRALKQTENTITMFVCDRCKFESYSSYAAKQHAKRLVGHVVTEEIRTLQIPRGVPHDGQG
jgi:hypothetical protein